MTCLVALRHARGAVLGADSAASYDGAIVRSPKLYRRGDVWLALCGDDDELGPLLDGMSSRAAPRDLPRWLRSRRLEGSGFAWSPRGGIVEWGSTVTEVLDYSATGSGWEYALGAIHALRAHSIGPAASALGALRAAASGRGDVSGPYVIVSLPSGRINWHRT